MYIYIKRLLIPLVLALGVTVMSTASVEARLVYSTEEDGVHTPAFNLDQDDTSDDFVDLNFGASSGAQLRYDVTEDKFFLNRDLDLSALELQDFKIERLASAPTCGPTDAGRMYFNTTTDQTFVCDGTTFNVLENATAFTGADITDGSIGDEDLDLVDITLNDFTNDAGFLTTVDVSDDTNLAAGTGATLTGDTISVDLGTDIATGELQDNAITSAKVLDATLTADDLADDAVSDAEIDFANVTLADFTNDSGFVTTDNDTTYSAGTGMNLVGTTFSTTLGTSVDDTELDFGSITLADFTNDAGFLTTVDVSDNTNLAAGTGATLTGDTISVDLGTSIDASEIDTDAVADDEIDYTAVTLADFTNDAGFVTTDNDTTYTASDGITLTGTNFTNDFSTAIETGEITDGTITFADLNNTDITLADFTNDAGFLTSVDISDDTNLTATDGIVLTGDQLSATLGTSIETAEIGNDQVTVDQIGGAGNNQVLTSDGTGTEQWEDKSIFATSAQGALANSALQSGDNISELVNDAGFVTTDNDTTYSAGTGMNLVGTTFSTTLGTSVDDTELDFGSITLADFTNDAGFLTTVDVSDNTNLAAGTGATLTGDTISVDLGTSIDASEIDTDAVADDEIDYTAVTLADFTNDAGFVTTDTDTTYTAGTGLTLSGTTFSNDLGTDIDISEIVSAGLGDANRILSTDATGVPQWEDRSNFATSAQGALADTALQSGDDISELNNDLGFITTDTDDQTLSLLGTNLTIVDGNSVDLASIDTDTTYTGGTGITIAGTTINNDFGNTIETGEISDGTITFADLNNTDITLNDFTNDANFLTTVDVSDDTNLAAGTGATLTGDEISVDLGTSIDATEIDTNAVADDEIDYTAVTLLDFTNDANFLTTVDVSDDTNLTAGTGATLTGDEISVDLGTSIDSAEIELNTIVADDINTDAVGSDELADDAVDTAAVQNDAITTDKIGTAGVGDANRVLTTDASGNPQWEDRSNFATNTLTTDNILVGVAGVATDTSVSGDLTMTGGDFQLTADSVTTTEITDGTITFADLNNTDITLADFTNDANFLTTVDVSDDTNLAAGTGATLTGDTISVDLGTTIETAEIGDNQVTLSKIADGGANQVLTTDGLNNPQWEDKTVFATSAQGALADTALQSGDDISELNNDLGFITTDTDTTYTAGTGLTLTGTSFSNDLGTSINASEIETNAVNDDEINYATVTLLDFTNDANYLTTVDVSDDTNLTAGTGATLTGDEISVDLGTSIDATEIDTNAVADDEIDYTAVTLLDFTNDAGFVTTDNDTTYTASDGITLTGTNFTNDFSTSIETGEITDGTITFADLNNTDITLADFTNDAGFVTTDNDTTYSAGAGMNLVGTTFSTTLGTDIDDTELDFGSITLADFTNDAGFLTTVDISDNTNLAAGTGATLTGDTISVDLGTSIDASEIDTDAVADDEIDYTAVTLLDFTNDAGFVTTDNDTTYTASDGITLTGTNFTNDFSTSIETGEITDGTITFADLNNTDITLADFTNDAGFVTTDNDTTYSAGAGMNLVGTTFSTTLGTDIDDTELDFGSITLADFTNDAGFLTTVDISDNTNLAAGTGATLTGDTISVDLGTSIDASEIDTDAVTDDEIDYTAVTLADFTNDAGFVTTDNDTTYTAGTGLTLTGTSFSNDLGTDIDTGELQDDAVTSAKILDSTIVTGDIADGTITFADLNNTDITLNDFTNDAGFLTTVDVSDNTNLTAGTGATLTGDTISVDLGTSIDSAEIELNTIVADDIATDAVGSDELADDAVDTAAIQNNTVDGTKIALGSDAEGDLMYYDGTDYVRLAAGTADQVLQMNPGATAPVWNNSTATKYKWVDIFGCIRGSASAGTVGGGNSPVVRFDGGNNSQMRCSFPVPSDWEAGTDVNIEVYYSPSDNTAGDVSFVLRHAAFGIGETISGGAFTDTLTGPETISATTQLDIYELTGDIPAATLAADDMININLRRQPGDAADTYTGDINIHQIRISYTGKELQ